MHSKHRHIHVPIHLHLESGGGWVVKRLTCGARRPGFEPRSRKLEFRDWIYHASKSRYYWKIVKATDNPILRLDIAYFAVAEGWLLLDIGWFVLFSKNRTQPKRLWWKCKMHYHWPYCLSRGNLSVLFWTLHVMVSAWTWTIINTHVLKYFTIKWIHCILNIS